MRESYDDDEVIDMITRSPKDREVALRYFYMEHRDLAKGILLGRGTSIQEAQDAIQDAIIILDKSIRNNRYEYNSTLKNYFLGICKGRVYVDRRSQKRIVQTDEIEPLDSVNNDDPLSLMLDTEHKDLVVRAQNMLSASCKKALVLYKLSYSMKEIAINLDLDSDNTARQRVFQCRKRFVKLIQSNPLFSNYFKEAYGR